MTSAAPETGSDSRAARGLSLRLRLIGMVVLAVLAGAAVGVYVDHRREHRVHLESVFASLQEQARTLQVARRRITERDAFADYVDEFCAQMNALVSPGHHILVLDASGQVLAHSRRHSGAEVERALLQADPAARILRVGDHDLVQVRVRDQDGAAFILAQYLDHMQAILRAQLLSRALTAGGLALVLIGLLSAGLSVWVLRPIGHLHRAARAWEQRRFAVRAPPEGAPDLRALALRFNAMAEAMEAHERARTAELERARAIQAGLLPRGLPQAPGLQFAAAYRPAAHVAGDLYDVFRLPSGRTAVAVFDVAGHGISAALLTGFVKMGLHWRLTESPGPARALEALNADLVAGRRFVTACVGVWDADGRTWTYASAGHPGGMLFRNSAAERLSSTGPPLGVVETAVWDERTVSLGPGARLFLYTDGILDAGAPANVLGEEGLERLLTDDASGDLPGQVRRILEAVAVRSAGSIQDDATILAMQVMA